MKTSFLFFTILCFTIHTQMMAQNSVIGKVLKKSPKDYLKTPTGDILPADAKRIDGEMEVWVVFSDRQDNQTYSSAADKSTPVKKLGFMQKCFVIEENNTHLHIVAFDDFAYDVKTKKITKNIEDYGWIAKDRMLLWKHALVNAKTKFTKKALVVNQKESLRNPEKYASQKNLRIFNNPELSQENTADVRLYDFLYIYKKEGKAVLLGKGLEFSAVSSATQILGWVSLDIIYEWDQRMVLEPNTGKKALSERKMTGVEVTVFDNQQSAEAFRNNGSADKANMLPFKDDFRTSFDPGWKRFPVIERIPNDIGDIVHTGIVSAVFDTTGTDIISLDEQSKIEAEYAKQRTKTRNINV
ncbi:MAG: hypothetical protein IT223_07790, partial [Crocinitomicaceae bacterium]|nr:hypothetical protein [Crocinitomicaceae bacterium]